MKSPSLYQDSAAFSDEDYRWMRLALDCASRGMRAGEVPIGAVIVREGRLLASGFNRPISDSDPSAHAEIIALREAARAIGNYRLLGCSIYVTIEPCAMCAAALVQARISRLVFGAREPRAGAVASRLRLLDEPWLNHCINWSEGLLAEQGGDLLRAFFHRARRSSRQ